MGAAGTGKAADSANAGSVTAAAGALSEAGVSGRSSSGVAPSSVARRLVAVVGKAVVASGDTGDGIGVAASSISSKESASRDGWGVAAVRSSGRSAGLSLAVVIPILGAGSEENVGRGIGVDNVLGGSG